MLAGARHVWARPAAAAALTAMGLHRVCYGVLTLMALLLYRNSFAGAGGLFPGGLAGLSEVLAAGAAGTLLAAVVTPGVVRRIGKPRWMTGLLAGSAAAQLGLGLPFTPPAVVAAGFVLGFAGQGIKICVDTTLQETVDDDFRGRVFSVYDTLFNVSYVVALVVGALLLPPSGMSVPVLLGVALVYLVASGVPQRGKRALESQEMCRS
jgi:MFS family permease